MEAKREKERMKERKKDDKKTQEVWFEILTFFLLQHNRNEEGKKEKKRVERLHN